MTGDHARGSQIIWLLCDGERVVGTLAVEVGQIAVRHQQLREPRSSRKRVT